MAGPQAGPSTIKNRSLESELRPQLHLSRVRERTDSADPSEAAAIYVRVRSTEIRVIERVIRF